MNIQSSRLVALQTPQSPGVPDSMVTDKSVLVASDAEVLGAVGSLGAHAKSAPDGFSGFGAADAGVTTGALARIGEFTFQGSQEDRTKRIGLMLKASQHVVKTYFPEAHTSAAVPFGVMQVTLSGASLAYKIEKQAKGQGHIIETALGTAKFGVDLLTALSQAAPGLQRLLPHAQTASVLLEAADLFLVPYLRVDYRLSQD